MSLTKEELDKFLKEKGETRAVVFETDANFVLKEEGEEGLKKLEKRVKELGYPIDYRNVRSHEWIPIGLRIISLLLIKDTFGWDENKIREMGRNAPNVSFVVRIALPFLLSPKKILEKAVEMWSNHFKDFGEVEAVEADEEKCETNLRIKGVKAHPLFHKYLEGYFEKAVSLGIRGRNIRTRETKCVYRGDPYCEYVTNWDPL